MDKELIISRICEGGLVAVVRADTGEQARRIADACLEGGVAAIEVTFTVPGAHRVIEALAAAYPGNEMLLGAGTVLDSETARIALLSGAQYIVSPGFDEGTIRLCNRYRVPVMPGIMTVTEAIRAMEAGADMLKVFPAGLFGPAILRDLKGPLPQAKFMPTGGVSVDNAGEWIAAGASALGAGGSLVAGAKTGNYQQITDTARAFIAAIRRARGQ